MVIFQYKAATSQLYFSRLLDLNDKDSTRFALQDFEMLLASVVPYKAFSRFLSTEYPEMIPYLQMVHLCKLYQDDLEMLSELEREQQICSEQVGIDYANKKRLSAYQKVSDLVQDMREKLKAREEQAQVIS